MPLPDVSTLPPMKTVRGVALVSLVLLAGCEKQRSLVSFEGRIFMHTTKSGSEAHDLTLSARGEKLRFDMKAPDGSPSHAVYDGATNQLQVFLDSQKSYLGLDFSAPKSAPNTSPTTSTITKAGTHKLVSGYDCEEWSVKDASGLRSGAPSTRSHAGTGDGARQGVSREEVVPARIDRVRHGRGRELADGSREDRGGTHKREGLRRARRVHEGR